MRRINTIAVLSMLMLALPATVAFAATFYGTAYGDYIKGTSSADAACCSWRGSSTSP